MKFYFKYFLLGIVTMLTVSIIVFFFNKNANSDDTNNKIIYIVESGNIKDSIEVVGGAELVDEQSLGFNIAGTVTKVNVKAGDYVKRNDVIAEIDNVDALNSIQDAKINLENAKISLVQLYELPDQSKILQAENAIKIAKSNLETSEKELTNLKISQENLRSKQLSDIENLKKDLASLNKNLDLSNQELEILKKEKSKNFDNTVSNKNTTIKNSEDLFKTYIVEIERFLEDSDYILGVTPKNKNANNSFEVYLGAKNSSYKSMASNLLLDSLSQLDNLKLLVNSYDYKGDELKIIEILDDFKNMYNKVYEMLDALYRTAENSLENSYLTQSMIDSIKNNAGNARNTSINRITSITSTINTLNTLIDTDLISNSNKNIIALKEESIKTQELNIAKLELNISNAIKIYEETLASQKVLLKSKDDDLKSKIKNLEITKKSYDELIKGPTPENIAKAENAIKQAQIRVENATKNLEDYELTAPFDGIIRKIDYMPGDNLKNDTDKYVYLENPDLLEIIVRLDQIDIVNVEVKNNAIITFDAYSSIQIKGIVTLIDTTPIVNAGVVSYEVKLVLDDPNFDKKILSGMTANVEIITNEKSDVLLLKAQAIKEKDGKKFVNVENDGINSEVQIEIGISSGGIVEVIDGLKKGDLVVYDEIIFTGSSINKSETFGPPWAKKSK